LQPQKKDAFATRQESHVIATFDIFNVSCHYFPVATIKIHWLQLVKKSQVIATFDLF
jgi:hypothetical protein